MAFSWTGDMTPFTADDTGSVPARFVLEQIDDREFPLVESFRYRTEDGRSIEVTPDRQRSSPGRPIPGPPSYRRA